MLTMIGLTCILNARAEQYWPCYSCDIMHAIGSVL